MHMMAKLAPETASPYLQKPARRKKQEHLKGAVAEPQHPSEPSTTPPAPFSSYEDAFSSAIATTVMFKNRASQTLNATTTALHTSGNGGGFVSVKEETPCRHGYMRVTLRAADTQKAANSRPTTIAPSSSVMSGNTQLLKSYAAPAPSSPQAMPLVTPFRSMLQGTGVASSSMQGRGSASTQGIMSSRTTAAGSGESTSSAQSQAACIPGSFKRGSGSPQQAQGIQQANPGPHAAAALSQEAQEQPASGSISLPPHAPTAGSKQQESSPACLSRLTAVPTGCSTTVDASACHKQADGALLQLWTMDCADAVRSHTAQKQLRRMLHTNTVPLLTALPLTPTSPRGTKKCYLGRSRQRQPRTAGAGSTECVQQQAQPVVAQQQVSCSSNSTKGQVRASLPAPLCAGAPVVQVHETPTQAQSADYALRSAKSAAACASSPDHKLDGELHRRSSVQLHATAHPEMPLGSAQRRRNYHSQVVQARSYVGGLDLPGEKFLNGLEALDEDAVKTTVLPLAPQHRNINTTGPPLVSAQAAATMPAPFLMGLAVDQLEQIYLGPDAALPSVSEVVASRAWHPPPEQLSKSGKHASAYQFADLMQLQGPNKDAFLAAACAPTPPPVPDPSMCGTDWSRGYGGQVDNQSGSYAGSRSPSRCSSPSASARLKTRHSNQTGRPCLQSPLQNKCSQYSQLLGSDHEVVRSHASVISSMQPPALQQAWAVADDPEELGGKLPATYSGRIPSITTAALAGEMRQLSPTSRSTSPQHRTRSGLGIALTSVPTPEPGCADDDRAGVGTQAQLQAKLQLGRSGKQLLALSGSSKQSSVMAMSRCTTATAKSANPREALRNAPAGSGIIGRGWAACSALDGATEQSHRSLGQSRGRLLTAPSTETAPVHTRTGHDVMEAGAAFEPSAFTAQMDGTVPQAGQSYGLDRTDSVDSDGSL